MVTKDMKFDPFIELLQIIGHFCIKFIYLFKDGHYNFPICVCKGHLRLTEAWPQKADFCFLEMLVKSILYLDNKACKYSSSLHTHSHIHIHTLTCV